MRSRRILPLVVCAVLLVTAACSGAGQAAAAAPQSKASESLLNRSLLASSPPVSAPVQNLPAGPNYNKRSGPSGAGCTPGNVATLPRGWWAGEIKSVAGSTAQFDMVCYYSGAAATKAASQDKTTAPNDYYIRNQSPKLRKVSFASNGTPATCVGGDNRPFGCTVGDVLKLYPGAGKTVNVGGKQAFGFPIVWVHSDGSKADYAYVQFSP